jgi:molybdopterin molybdotransferase
MLFGRRGAQRIIGLPGNPLSCLIAARIFLVPLLFKLAGRTDSPLQEHAAVLANDLPANGPRQHYMRAVETWNGGDLPSVATLGSQDSSHMSALVAANVLLVRPPDAHAAKAGDVGRVLPLDF